MRIYAIKNSTGTLFFSDMIATRDHYLVPLKDSNCFDAYPKDVFTLEIMDVKEPEPLPAPGFEQGAR